MKKSSLIAVFTCCIYWYSNSYAANYEDLALACKDLAQTVFSLQENQSPGTCIDKLQDASQQLENAGNHLFEEEIGAAKEALEVSVSSLQYAELTSCKHYIQISHSKAEAHKIKNAL